VFGEGVRIPTLNFFGTIFGTSQTRLPRKNFPQFILMMFIILCLILRTCYQSMLYDLMQKDLRRKELQTIDEAIAKGYKFYMQKLYITRYNNAEFYDKLRIVDIGHQHGNFKTLLKYAEKTVDHEFDGVVAFTTEDVDLVGRDFYRTGVSSLRMMKQKTGMFPQSFRMDRRNVLVKPYNDMILRLFEAGITEFLEELYYKRGQKVEPFGPQVLDFNHLGACFLVCLAPLVLAFGAFLFEIFWKKFSKTFAENYNDIDQKMKISGLDCLKQIREKDFHKTLSECIGKKKSSANVPKNKKFIQVQPRNSEI
jgi:hypothetical protein